MNWIKITGLMFAGLLLVTMTGCNTGDATVTPESSVIGEVSGSESGEVVRPEEWTSETHSNEADPDYEVVFPQDKVNQIKITISPDNWQVMQANMTELYGVQGAVRRDGQVDFGDIRPEGEPPEAGVRPEWGVQPGTGEIPGEGAISVPGEGVPEGAPLPPGGAPDTEGRLQRIPGWADMTDENPVWVPATVEFDGYTWTNVGIRYKGNSSLTSGWRSDSPQLPLKLDFDEFEDEYPEIENQRFYGFKQLSLSNAFSDTTCMRDVLASDILEDAGLLAAETAYYEVIVDYGEGPVNLGLYVMIEVIDDTAIERYFGDDSGNIYEGDGRATSLAEGTFSQIESSFQKENNTQEADWSDIEELYTVLHSDNRISNPETWREDLESVFDVESFLEWLAVSGIIQHWDTYGLMPHNFYLYNNPDTGLLTWISWDHNMVLGVGSGGGRRGMPPESMSLSRDEVNESWPLIRYLLDDPVYYEKYVHYIEEALEGSFDPEALEKRCRDIAQMIAPYITQDSDETEFESAVEQLIDRIYERYEAASKFLAGGK